MSSQPSNVNLPEWSDLISAVVVATISRSQSTLDQLLNQVIHVIPSKQPEYLRAQTANNLLIQITKELEKSLESATHSTLAWFVVYVGLSSAPPEAMQAVQMILEKGFKPFEDFFVDRQGIHFYNHGATAQKLEQIPERLSEFTQMTVRMNTLEVNHIIDRFNLSEADAKTLLLNLKILEKKMKLPIEQLLSVLDDNDELLQQVIQSDLTSSSDIKGFGI
ncbi:MAG TPA: hypothetical protein V6D14_17155 [Coleofasciculaceae cyanobacterium]|jgi:hypothetical protein